MNTILNMTMSLNAMVALENNSTSCFTQGEWPVFVELAQKTGALIWGRKVHEVVRGYGEQALKGFDGMARIVVSHNPHFGLEPGWQLAASPEQALTLLTAAGHARAVLGGGAGLNTAFAQAGLINEVIIFMESLIVGRGVPLFAPQAFDLRLHLLEMKQLSEEVVQLRYQVRPDA